MEFIKRHALSGGLFILSLALIGGVLVGSVDDWSTDGSLFQDNSIDTVGEIRKHRLDQLTTNFVKENPKADILYVDGRRLAPMSYINSELRELEASWRVKILDGELELREVA